MLWTLLALALWVVLGGFISYFGDLQGRRWGKKRVSWFGMRPKHTAILITSLTGGFIALMSIASVMLVAPTVRDVVLRGETAIHDNKRLIEDQKKQQLKYNSEIGQYLKQRDETKRLADAGSLELKKLHVQLASTESQLSSLLKKMNGLQVAILGMQSEKRTLQSINKKLQADNKNLDEMNLRAGVFNMDLGKQNMGLEHDMIDLRKSKAVLETANKTLSEINTHLKDRAEGYRKQSDTFYTYNLNLEKEKNTLERQVAEMQHDRDEAIALISQRDQLNSQIQALNQLYAQKYAVLRQGRVGLRAGVELSRQLIPSHLRPEAIKDQVVKLLATASDRAKSYGSVADTDGRTAKLLSQKKVTLTGYEDRDEDAQIDEIAQKWAGQDVACVVVVTTVTNCLTGEPAYVELHSYPVVRVYAKGAEVASRTIDGHSSVDKIIEELVSFLHKDVKDAAIQAGTIPKVDPDTGATEVGILGTGDLFRLTERVRKMHGPVKLTARARQDLSSADTLNLTFHVARMPSPVNMTSFP